MAVATRWRYLQIADSAFPTGGFAHSAGLEAAVHLGRGATRPSSSTRFVRGAPLERGARLAAVRGRGVRRSRFASGDSTPALDALADEPRGEPRRAARRGGRSLATCARVFDEPSIAALAAPARGRKVARRTSRRSSGRRPACARARARRGARALPVPGAPRRRVGRRFGSASPGRTRRSACSRRHAPTLDAVLAACAAPATRGGGLHGARARHYARRLTTDSTPDSSRAEESAMAPRRTRHDAHDHQSTHADHGHTEPHGHTHERLGAPGPLSRPGARRAARLRGARVHRGHRRPRRQRKDRARPRALPGAPRPDEPGRRDERHLHPRRRRVPASAPGARRRPHPRGRNRRLPARGDPRRHQPQPRRARAAHGRRAAPSSSSSRAAATTSPRSSAASSSTSRFTSSTSPAATRSPARAAPESRSPICSSSTRPTSRPHVGASLDVMARDARAMRGDGPFVFAQANATASGSTPSSTRFLRARDRRAMRVERRWPSAKIHRTITPGNRWRANVFPTSPESAACDHP